MADWIDSLERLSALRAAGHITEAEFEAAKAQVLGRPGAAQGSPPAAAPPPPPPAQPPIVATPFPPPYPAGPAVTARAPAPFAPARAVRRPIAPGAWVPPPGVDREQEPPPRPAGRGRGALLIVGGFVAAVLLVAAMVWLLLPPVQPAGTVPHPRPTEAAGAFPSPGPQLPPLAAGQSITWRSDTAVDTIERQVGPMQVRITKVGSGDAVAPAIELTFGGGSVRLEGEHVAATYEHRITALQNRAGAAPVVLLQSYTGGAHCCQHLQLAGLSGGQLKVVDLGNVDGDMIDAPRDVSGDGVADFVLRDQSFLYAFAPFAMSVSVPKVLNVVGGRVVDVSARPAFRRLYADIVRSAGESCRSGADGQTRNGACPAYVAAAARTGHLDQAWREMLAGYDASVEWQLPTGCSVAVTTDDCPADRQVQYQSYPDALLAFLKRHGYIARAWQPHAATPPADDAEPDPYPPGSGKN